MRYSQLGLCTTALSLAIVGCTTPYHWRELPQVAPFPAADSSPNAVVHFAGRFWLLSAWNNTTGEWRSTSQVWASDDASAWQCVNALPPYDPYSAFVAFRDAIWAIGPIIYCSTNGSDWVEVNKQAPIPVASRVVIHKNELWVSAGQTVWKSSDGISWELIVADAPWGKRQWPGWISFANALWLIGGSVGYGEQGERFFADVWRSANGRIWERVQTNAPWGPRYWSAIIAFNDKLWLFGGWKAEAKLDASRHYGNLSDVWFSKNGTHWQKLTDNAPWQPRHAPYVWVKDKRLFLAAGYGGGDEQGLYRDVWALERSNTR